LKHPFVEIDMFVVLGHGLMEQSQVPDNYIRAIFGSYLASRFVYTYGVNASQFAFFDFMNKRMAKIKA